MMSKSPHKTMMVQIVVCLLLLILGPVMYKNMMDTLDDKDKDIKEKQDKWHQMNKEIKSNQLFVEKWQGIREFLDKTVEHRRTNFATYLDTWKQECGFDFSLLSVTSGQLIKGKHKYQELSYNRSFETDLARVVEFLSRLDKSQNLLRIDQLVIRQNSVQLDYFMSSDDKVGDLDVTIAVSIPAAASPDDNLTVEAPRWKE